MTVERRQQCERRGISRVVELRETPGGGLPCEVIYLKPDEDSSESTLWTAKTDRGFCAARFEAFVVKLESRLGWSCGAADETPVVVVPEASNGVVVVPSAARPAEPFETEGGAAAIASRAEPPDRTVEPAPTLGEAVPTTPGTLVTDGVDEALSTPFDRLRSLAPSGTYVAVPVPSGERESDVRIASWCPPGGTFSWTAEDPQQPVFSLGETIAFAVRLPDRVLDETFVLPIVSSVGAGATRELQTLSSAPAERDGRAIDIRVAPRGPGSGALSPGICRYALGG